MTFCINNIILTEFIYDDQLFFLKLSIQIANFILELHFIILQYNAENNILKIFRNSFLEII